MPRRLLTHSILRSPMYLPSVASIFKMGRMGFSSGSLVADMMKKKNWVGVVRAYNRQRCLQHPDVYQNEAVRFQTHFYH